MSILGILVAEDNPVNQKLTDRLLEKYGHRMSMARNGREVVEMTARYWFDLVLMDVQMPEMNGLEGTAAIRQRNQGTGSSPRFPVVAITAHDMKGDEAWCLERVRCQADPD